VEFEEATPFLKPFMVQMYDTKIKNKIDNPALAQMAKLAMNSLTGKFG